MMLLDSRRSDTEKKIIRYDKIFVIKFGTFDFNY